MTDFDLVQWITTGEAATLTGYSQGYFRQAIARGLLKGKKRGRDWFLSKEEVLTYAETMRQLGPSKHNPWKDGGRERSKEAE